MQDTQPAVFPYKIIGDEKSYTTDWLTDRTIEFIEQNRGEPFCYVLSLPDPHQTNNLFGRAEYAAVTAELTERIIRHHHELNSPAAAWLAGLRR